MRVRSSNLLAPNTSIHGNTDYELKSNFKWIKKKEKKKKKRKWNKTKKLKNKKQKQPNSEIGFPVCPLAGEKRKQNYIQK